MVILFREMDLLLVPYWADTQLDLIQWPPFLLASKVCFILLYETTITVSLESFCNSVCVYTHFRSRLHWIWRKTVMERIEN